LIQEYDNLKDDVSLSESIRYEEAIISIHYWTGIIHCLKEDYLKAAYHLEIVRNYTRPPSCNNTPSIEPWQRYQDYLIALLQLGDIFYLKKDYAASRKYFEEIIQYRALIRNDIQVGKKNIGRALREQGYPQELLIRAAIGLAFVFPICTSSRNATANSFP
jgi:hypothetical protein